MDENLPWKLESEPRTTAGDLSVNKMVENSGGDCNVRWGSVKGSLQENIASDDNSNGDPNARMIRDLEGALSEKVKQRINQILVEIESLSATEKCLLYLKLPTEGKEVPDPLRQPLNPLGSRLEINHTITWIKTHLEEDPDISLQKKGVYEEYKNYCERNGIKCLSTADFGKVMKQVYPKVRPRRLGTRGNSQYCYSGLRNRIKLSVPSLPDLCERTVSTEPLCNKSELQLAAWAIIQEWAEGQLNSQFQSLVNLAYHLVVKCSVAMGTQAANTIVTSKKVHHIMDSAGSSSYINKHRETTLQLQRKLQQKNVIGADGFRDLKRKMQNQKDSKRKKCKSSIQAPLVQSLLASNNNSLIAENLQQQQPQQSEHIVCDKSLDFRAPGSTNNCAAQSTSVINSLQVLPDFSSFKLQHVMEETAKDLNVSQSPVGTTPQAIEGKVEIPRLISNRTVPQQSLAPLKRTKNACIQPKLMTAVNIEPACDITTYNSQLKHPSALAVDTNRSQEKKICRRVRTIIDTDNGEKMCNNNALPDVDNNELGDKKDFSDCGLDEESPIFTRERLISISKVNKDDLDDYLGTSNSQECEEELTKYLENNNTPSMQPTGTVMNMSSSNSNTPVNNSTVIHVAQNSQIHQEHTDIKEKQLSQVRQMLIEQSQVSSQIGSNSFLTGNRNDQNIIQSFKRTQLNFKSMPTTPISTTVALQPVVSGARRRVSFETQHASFEESVPPSPNTRVQNLNFTPISPGPKSPLGGRISECSSTNASPFVSPRNTPVPRARGNSHPYPLGQNQNISSATLLNNPNPRKLSKARKIKSELGLKLENPNDMLRKDMPFYGIHFPMSAPHSPKLPILQNLLQSPAAYTPDYTQSHQQIQCKIPLGNQSPVLPMQHQPTHQLSVESQQHSHFRSQSVPLPNVPESNFTHFNFDACASTTASSEETSNADFNDIGHFPTSENINMTKLIDSLQESPLETLDTLDNMTPAEFDSVLGSGNYNSEVGVEPQTTEQMGSRWMNRSQSLNVDIDYSSTIKCSRSVPATPIPYNNLRKVIPIKLEIGEHSSRSYPSTPLMNETFNYPAGQDFLLNGQPIKETVSLSGRSSTVSFLDNSQRNSDNVINNTANSLAYDILTETAAPEDLLIGDHETKVVTFNVEEPMCGSVEDGCDMIRQPLFHEEDLNGS